jgi:hypothetical protein
MITQLSTAKKPTSSLSIRLRTFFEVLYAGRGYKSVSLPSTPLTNRAY